MKHKIVSYFYQRLGYIIPKVMKTSLEIGTISFLLHVEREVISPIFAILILSHLTYFYKKSHELENDEILHRRSSKFTVYANIYYVDLLAYIRL